MARLLIHHAVEGSRPLVEFYGTPSAVVLMTPYAVYPVATRFADLGLTALSIPSLAALDDQGLGATVCAIPLLSVATVESDANGFAHWIVPAVSLLSAGVVLRVDGTVLT